MKRTITLLLIAVSVAACAGSYKNKKEQYPYLTLDDFLECVHTTPDFSDKRESCYQSSSDRRDPVQVEKLKKWDYEIQKSHYEWLTWEDYLACLQLGKEKGHKDYFKSCIYESNKKSTPDDVKRAKEAERLATIAANAAKVEALKAEQTRHKQELSVWRQKIKVGDTCWAGPYMAQALYKEVMMHGMVIEVKSSIVRLQFDGSTNTGVTINLPTREEWVKRENVYPAEEYQVVRGNQVYTPSSWPQ